jgi:N-acetylmuramoyl-L-alanine amidase
MFKIAYGAGHNLFTAGRRIPKALDPNKTKEWQMNDRVARYFAEAAGQYDGVELLRVDDPAGQAPVDLAARCRLANEFGANMFASFHHNGGIELGTGGGIVAYSYPGSAKGAKYRDSIYDACIAAGGLKGNRSNPKTTDNFQVLRETNAPAVLMEYGFMDSRTDAPVIITEAYSKLVGYATMEGIAKVAGLKKKSVAEVKPSESYSLTQFIKDVQKACGASVDGIAGPETLSKTVTLSASKNRRHAAVKPVQKRLYALGYTVVGEADGVAGPKFEAAVIAFQEDNGCWVDGEITAGCKTWKKLLEME